MTAPCFVRNGMPVTERQVVDALKHRYIDEESGSTNVSPEDLAAYVRQLTTEQLTEDHSILEIVAKDKTDWVLSGAEIAILHSVRDCMTMVFRLVDLEDEVAELIWGVTPNLAAELLANPVLPLNEKQYSVFSILDLLLDATIGWSPDQGRAGEKLLKKVASVIEVLNETDTDHKALETGLTEFLDKEQGRIKKLEERLAASETGQIRSQRCRTIAAEMINAAMAGNQLTEHIADFLKGPWFESMQLLALKKGINGEDWQRAVKMTETIIWTYQPIAPERQNAEAEKQRLYRIIEHLPSEISDLLVALEYNDEEFKDVIGEIEAEHVAIISGGELAYEDFEPLAEGDDSISDRTTVSKILLRKVMNLEPGQWFIYDEQEKSARIKLVLKLEDVKQMLFTNRNGMKALQKSFDEITYLMSSSVIKPLNHEAVISSTFATVYQGLIDEHQRKLKLAEEADQEEAEKEAARQKALREAEALDRAKEEAETQRKEQEAADRLERAKAEAAKSENLEKVAEFTEKVHGLQIGAWLKLPGPAGMLEECKLAVKVASADKLIFVNRIGMKIGDYSTEQLVALLVTEEGEIDDTGVEFEDTLAQVVSKLRQDRDKSYDDLTGG